jgi:hypothetical protein
LEYECKRGSVWGYQQEKEKERVLGDEMIWSVLYTHTSMCVYVHEDSIMKPMKYWKRVGGGSEVNGI